VKLRINLESLSYLTAVCWTSTTPQAIRKEIEFWLSSNIGTETLVAFSEKYSYQNITWQEPVSQSMSHILVRVNCVF
jgi:hypothetical protein